MTNYELQHYGILGMRWGISRAKTPRSLGKVSAKLKTKKDKVTSKINKAEARAVKLDKAKAQLSKGLALKTASAILNILPGSRQYAQRSAKRISVVMKASVKNNKKISKQRKLLLKYDVLENTLQKKVSQLSATSITRGKSIINNPSPKGVKK
jgi:hypothetical protein